MIAKVKYFGWVADIKKMQSEELEHNFMFLEELVAHIVSKSPSILDKNYRVSLNQNLNPSTNRLENEDEIAFLPPFSGG